MKIKTPHQIFVDITKELLLEKRAYSVPLPVGNWLTGIKCPDVLVWQHTSIGRYENENHVNKEYWQSSYDLLFIVECKISVNDMRNALYQLLMATMGISGKAYLDLNHGGVRPVLAFSPELEKTLSSTGLLDVVIEVYKELHFSILIVDKEKRDYRWLVWGDDSYSGNP